MLQKYFGATFLVETSSRGEHLGSVCYSWNGEQSIFLRDINSFFIRGGSYKFDKRSGYFSFSSENGYNGLDYGFRIAVVSTL